MIPFTFEKTTLNILQAFEEMIIEQDGDESNAGDDEDNGFTLYLEMGTQEGDMNSESICELDHKKGTYNVDVNFINTEVL